MKNVLLGFVGTLILLYSIVISLSIYGIKSRENEMNRCLSQIGVEILENNYVPEFLRTQDDVAWSYECYRAEENARNQLIEDIEQRSSSDTELNITVICCDMERGLLSYQVEESFLLPMGRVIHRNYERTLFVDKEG